MTRQDFQTLLKDAPILLDGATGSNLMRAGMPKGVCTEQWILEHPQILIDLQRDYVKAGTQILYTPTFAANRISLGEHGLAGSLEDMIPRLVDLSRTAAEGHALLAGDITTTGKTDLPYEQLLEVYQEQISHLAAAGVDLLIAETMIGAEETMAAIDAAHAACDLPILCSLTIEADGSLFFGGNIFETAAMLEELGADAVGINCSVGPDQLESVVATLKSTVSVPVIAKPNAGMPVIDESGNAIYSMGPEDFALHMQKLVSLGASLIGGCCGTTPDYIRQIRKRIL